ncbi:FKBP-type peptidyl-prolyl cis-trans isomerase [Anaeromyxobacter terrae]|uniref:FKBP-type peptidyl-prolyl cis-trans isomerase n=1 Tax=Anaeromyxobacter terrae TaxID=2925406 RepID=UPI001F57C360|nr:FKBP-type peptidyl-prolyl cis-trans isomerase [Anaeromyxobacter sp. SG22]
MRKSLALLAALTLGTSAHAQGGKAPEKKPAPAPAAAAAEKKESPADTEKTLYSVGLAVANSLQVFALTPAELEIVMKGIRDGATGKAKTDLDPKTGQAVNDFARSRMEKANAVASAKEKETGPAYLAKAAGEKGAVKTASGAVVIPIKEGTGASPTAADKVKVHYTGTLVNGKVFDSSVQRGQPAEFPLGGVIKCWTEGLQKMKVGGKAKLVCPSDIAYGAQGRPPVIPGNAVLTFEIELLEIVK